MMAMLPGDPIMLYSVLNTKLRDQYSSFEQLCEDLDVDAEEITKKLEAADFRYNPDKNQFE